MKDQLPKEKCHKCKKKAIGWIAAKPVCIFCFDKIKNPRKAKNRELQLKKRRSMGIVC